MDRDHASEALVYANTDLRHGVCAVFPSLENTIVISLSYKTLAVRSRSKSIAEKHFTASTIFLREGGFMSILETPVHTGEPSSHFFCCLESMADKVMGDFNANQES